MCEPSLAPLAALPTTHHCKLAVHLGRVLRARYGFLDQIQLIGLDNVVRKVVGLKAVPRGKVGGAME